MIWAQERAPSNYAPDGQLLLSLAGALLTMDGTREPEVVDAIDHWWKFRRARARLPWLLEALDLLTEHATDMGRVAALWIDGVELVRRDPSRVSRAELMLWRQIGQRLDLNAEEIDDALSTTSAQVAALSDPLVSMDLRKIAIVTLQERAARAAADLLRPRTNAVILLVVEEVAGAATAAALDADVILFVWAANKHAVYRAFDSVRERLEYVQGTGPSSIILALERWAIKRKPPEV